MANLKANKKNIKRIKVQAQLNKDAKSNLKTLRKKMIAAADADEKKSAAQNYVSALDKAVKRGILHPNRASSQKSSVSKLIFA